MYKRILLKLSGEGMKGNSDSIIEAKGLEGFAQVIKSLHDEGVEIGIVIGAGNIWRGKLANTLKIEAVPADYMGMLGTVINATCLASHLKGLGVDCQVFSALGPISDIIKGYDKEEAKKSLSEGKVTFFAGGTGKPFFTTDTAATLRALECECDAIFMGKNNVEGVYTADPSKDPDAKFIPIITYDEMIKNNLQVMDKTAVELLLDKDIEIRVFSMSNPENFIKVAKGENIGTICRRGK